MPTRLHGNRRECPVGACPRTVRPGQLMCRAHWALVPKGLQTEVYRTWRKWNDTMSDDDWGAYLTARTAALEAAQP